MFLLQISPIGNLCEASRVDGRQLIGLENSQLLSTRQLSSDTISSESASRRNNERTILPRPPQNSSTVPPIRKKSNIKGISSKDRRTGLKKETRLKSSHYDCAFCSAQFGTVRHLQKHVRQHENKQPVAVAHQNCYCPVDGCFFVSINRLEFDRHMENHVINENITPKGKKRKSKLDAPLKRLRHDDEEMKCYMCAYTCTVEKSYEAHMDLHKNGKEIKNFFSCPVCGKDFSTSKEKEDHFTTKHVKIGKNGKKIYQCDLCEFSSYQLKKLIQHRRMHDGTKPHECFICKERFARKDYLLKHIQTIHGKVKFYADSYHPLAAVSSYPPPTKPENVNNALQTTSADPGTMPRSIGNFGNNSGNNSFGNNSGNISFENNSGNNSFGNNSGNISFGNNSGNISFGNNSFMGLSTGDQMNFNAHSIQGPHGMGGLYATPLGSYQVPLSVPSQVPLSVPSQVPLSVPSSRCATSSFNEAFLLPLTSNIQAN